MRVSLLYLLLSFQYLVSAQLRRGANDASHQRSLQSNSMSSVSSGGGAGGLDRGMGQTRGMGEANSTPAPAGPTLPPANPTPAPVSPSPAPVSPSPAPVSPIVILADETLAPVSPSPAPSEQTPPPVKTPIIISGPTFHPTPMPKETGRSCPTAESPPWQLLADNSDFLQSCDTDADCINYFPEIGPACCSHPFCVCATLYRNYQKEFECISFWEMFVYSNSWSGKEANVHYSTQYSSIIHK